MAEPNYTILKIVFFGQSGVGKSALVTRQIDDKFHQGYFLSTIGIDFKIKLYLVNDLNVKACFWDSNDCSGQKYKTQSLSYYRGAHALVLCFDLSKDLHINQLQIRINKARSVNQQGKLFLIGCKADCGSSISEQVINNLAEKYQVRYHKTSSKMSHGVSEAFSQMVEEALKVRLKVKITQGVNPGQAKKTKEQCQIM